MEGVIYQSIQLAGLLHDIGKFLHRVPGIRGAHQEHSARFVEENLPVLNKDPGWVDINLVKTLVKYHHGGISQASADERLRVLVRLLKRRIAILPVSAMTGNYYPGMMAPLRPCH